MALEVAASWLEAVACASVWRCSDTDHTTADPARLVTRPLPSTQHSEAFDMVAKIVEKQPARAVVGLASDEMGWDCAGSVADISAGIPAGPTVATSAVSASQENRKVSLGWRVENDDSSVLTRPSRPNVGPAGKDTESGPTSAARILHKATGLAGTSENHMPGLVRRGIAPPSRQKFAVFCSDHYREGTLSRGN